MANTHQRNVISPENYAILGAKSRPYVLNLYMNVCWYATEQFGTYSAFVLYMNKKWGFNLRYNSLAAGASPTNVVVDDMSIKKGVILCDELNIDYLEAQRGLLYGGGKLPKQIRGGGGKRVKRV